MGCALSAETDPEGKARSKNIDRDIKNEAKTNSTIVKLLLLGAGESGKSTIAKQMRILYQDGYSDSERNTYRQVVFANILQSMKAIVKAMPGLEISFEDPERQNDANIIQDNNHSLDDIELTGEIGEALQRLWADTGVRESHGHAGKYQLNDSAEYYLDELKRISEKDYIPSEQDVLRSRVKTTGIIETAFAYKTLQFRLIDVGGQRSERRKWIHCFEDVTAIIFCVALSAYDLLLVEDEETNRMQESLQLFDAICNNPWFRSTSTILFLNKTDLFRKKLEKSSITICFPDYDGENTFDQSATFIQVQFEMLNRHPEKVIYTHFTCATDTSNVQFVFDAVSDVILTKVLGDLGLMSS